MRVQLAPCQSCGADVPRQITYCDRCGHEAHCRPGRCHCPGCMAARGKGTWKALESEEDAARWEFFCTLAPDREEVAA